MEAVLYIACHTGTEPVRGRDISGYQGVAVRYLEPMLQKLVHAGILRGVRGPKGGYLLARERRKIPVSEIIDVVQMQPKDTKEATSALHRSIISPIWESAKTQVMQQFSGVTIQDLCQQAVAKNIRIGKSAKDDFTI